MRNATTECLSTGDPRKRNRRARRLAPSPARRTVTTNNLDQELRRAFFARGGTLATRYAVTLPHVLAHVEVAEDVAHAGCDTHHTLSIGRIPNSIEDLVVATACCHGISRAWLECREANEVLLSRACEMRLEEIDALLFVRRFWDDLEARTLGTRGTLHSSGPRMQDYLGTRPLRVWLADRLFGTLETMARQGRLPGTPHRAISRDTQCTLRLVD